MLGRIFILNDCKISYQADSRHRRICLEHVALSEASKARAITVSKMDVDNVDEDGNADGVFS